MQTPHFPSAVVVRRNYHCTVMQCCATSTLAATFLHLGRRSADKGSPKTRSVGGKSMRLSPRPPQDQREARLEAGFPTSHPRTAAQTYAPTVRKGPPVPLRLRASLQHRWWLPLYERFTSTCRYFSSSCRMRSICLLFQSLWASPSEKVLSYQASRISRITGIGVARRLKANTLAWFHTRAPRAVWASCTKAARMPGTLLAAILAPVPVQQQTMPSSASPAATVSATCAHTSGQSDSSSLATGPKAIIS